MTWSKIKSSKAFLGISKFIDNINKHNLLTLSGALAFNTALSLAPLVLIFLKVLSVLGDGAQNRLLSRVQDFLGPEAASAVRMVVENSQQSPNIGSLAGLIGVIIVFISASSVFAQLQFSLNIIWETGPAQSMGVWKWLSKRVLSLGIMLAVGFVAAVSLILDSLIAFFFLREGILWHMLNMAISLLVFSVLFGFMFSYLPDRKLSLSQGLKGGFLTAILFSIGKFFIGFYLGRSAVSSSYGAAGSLVVLLIWVYYSSFILFAGAELTQLLVFDSEDRRLKPT